MKRTISILTVLFLMLTLSGGLLAVAADTSIGTTLRLAKAEGSVTVTNKNGKTLKFTENMKLYNAYIVTTSAKSYAYISLDDSKAIKLDAGTQVEIRKSGKKLEVHLVSGNVFCNVTVPLKKDEDLNITTSTTITGIRGTSLCVSESTDGTEIQVYSGHVVTAVYNALNRLSGERAVEPGEKLSAAAFSGGATDIGVSKISMDAIPGFVAVMLENDPGIKENMARIGIDVETLITEAQTILKNEQDAKGNKDVYHPSGNNSNTTPSPSPSPAPSPPSSGRNDSGGNSGGSSNSGEDKTPDEDKDKDGDDDDDDGNEYGGDPDDPVDPVDPEDPPEEVDSTNIDFDVSVPNAAVELQNMLNDSDATYTSITLTGGSLLQIEDLEIPVGMTLVTNVVNLKLQGNNINIDGFLNITGGKYVSVQGNIDIKGTLNVRNGNLTTNGNTKINAGGTLNIYSDSYVKIIGNFQGQGAVTGDFETVATSSSNKYFFGSWDDMTEFVNLYNSDSIMIVLYKNIDTNMPLWSTNYIKLDGNNYAVSYTGKGTSSENTLIKAYSVHIVNCKITVGGTYYAVASAGGSLQIEDCEITAGAGGSQAALESSGALAISGSEIYSNGGVSAIYVSVSALIDGDSTIYVNTGYVVRPYGSSAAVDFASINSVYTGNKDATIETLFAGCTTGGTDNYVIFVSTVTSVGVSSSDNGNGYFGVTLNT